MADLDKLYSIQSYASEQAELLLSEILRALYESQDGDTEMPVISKYKIIESGPVLDLRNINKVPTIETGADPAVDMADLKPGTPYYMVIGAAIKLTDPSIGLSADFTVTHSGQSPMFMENMITELYNGDGINPIQRLSADFQCDTCLVSNPIEYTFYVPADIVYGSELINSQQSM